MLSHISRLWAQRCVALVAALLLVAVAAQANLVLSLSLSAEEVVIGDALTATVRLVNLMVSGVLEAPPENLKSIATSFQTRRCDLWRVFLSSRARFAMLLICSSSDISGTDLRP